MNKLETLKQNIKRNQKVERISLKDHFSAEGEKALAQAVSKDSAYYENSAYYEDSAIATKFEADEMARRNKQAARIMIARGNYQALEGLAKASPKWVTEEMTEEGCKIKMFIDKRPQKYMKAPPTLIGCNFNEGLYKERIAKYKAYNTFISKRTGDEISLDDLVFSDGTVRVRKKPWYKFW